MAHGASLVGWEGGGGGGGGQLNPKQEKVEKKRQGCAVLYFVPFSSAYTLECVLWYRTFDVSMKILDTTFP